MRGGGEGPGVLVVWQGVWVVQQGVWVAHGLWAVQSGVGSSPSRLHPASVLPPTCPHPRPSRRYQHGTDPTVRSCVCGSTCACPWAGRPSKAGARSCKAPATRTTSWASTPVT
eukprot:353358-Chlamydomonas_euryale.AAC.2